MQEVFIASSVDLKNREYTRGSAYGYNRLVISDDVESLSAISIESSGTDLVVKKVEYVDGDEEKYVILCKEFGLVGLEANFKSDISVIFLDDGYMLVTLTKGGLILNLDDKLMMPNLGTNKTPNVNKDDILWVNAEYLTGYRKYWGTAGKFLYDTVVDLTIGGSYHSKLWDFSIVHNEERDIDISLGAIADYEFKQKAREESQKSGDLNGGITSYWSSYDDLDTDFDTDDSVDYEDYDEDDYEDDYGDGFEDDYGDDYGEDD